MVVNLNMNDMKKVSLVLLLCMSSLMTFAQASGGQIRRDPKVAHPNSNLNTSKRPSGSEAYTPNLTDAEKSIIINKIRDHMVFIDGGVIEYQESDNPSHICNVSSFSINKYEVTQEEWLAVMGNNPSTFKGNKRPVESVTYNDCILFIQKLNLLTGLNYRLPTNEEWIFAAKGGLKSKNYTYIGSNDFKSTTWYAENSGKKTKAVGKKTANELGLYDMSGNVSEYCQEIIYTNPVFGTKEERICYRGGSIIDYSQFDWRFNANEWNHTYNEGKQCRRDFIGLRLAL